MANCKPIPSLDVQQRARFWAKVKSADAQIVDVCWLWTGAIQPNGYGILHANGRTMRAHRVAYVLWYGQIPADLVLDHLCHNRACVNPHHLEPITFQENLGRIGPQNRRHRVRTGICVQCNGPSETYRCAACRKKHNEKDKPSQRKPTRKNH